MPFYHQLDPGKPDDVRTIRKILDLRRALRAEIPERTHSKTLLLATWNIRDFDKPAYGRRLRESYYYMAEIIASFDLVAIQEVYRDLTALNRLMAILGRTWDYVFSDATEGDQGNDERIAFLYDSRKIRFGGLAGELVIPPRKETVTGEDGKKTAIYHPVGQIWRTPLICGFQAGWAKFMICSVHIQWGDDSAEPVERLKEIEHIADFLKKRTEDETAWARKLILLGDFNIFNKKDKTYEILTDREFICPPPLQNVFTNMGSEKRQYDQILLRERENSLKVKSGGTFHFFDTVFKDEEKDIYMPSMIKANGNPNNPEDYYKSYNSWRTHQMSDHLPLWVEIEVDFADEYLQKKLEKVA